MSVMIIKQVSGPLFGESCKTTQFMLSMWPVSGGLKTYQPAPGRGGSAWRRIHGNILGEAVCMGLKSQIRIS